MCKQRQISPFIHALSRVFRVPVTASQHSFFSLCPARDCIRAVFARIALYMRGLAAFLPPRATERQVPPRRAESLRAPRERNFLRGAYCTHFLHAFFTIRTPRLTPLLRRINSDFACTAFVLCALCPACSVERSHERLERFILPSTHANTSYQHFNIKSVDKYINFVLKNRFCAQKPSYPHKTG